MGLNSSSYIASVRNYTEELGFTEMTLAPTVCWPPVLRWLWSEADVQETQELGECRLKCKFLMSIFAKVGGYQMEFLYFLQSW